jgi:hypothetical protein
MQEERRFVKPPEFIVTKPEGMPILYVTGVFGGLAPNDARMLFFADRIEPESADVPGTQKVKRINQEIQAEVHMSPATFKSVALWMMSHIETYEKAFGEIQMGAAKEETKSKEGYVK